MKQRNKKGPEKLLACVAYAVPLMTPIIAKRFVSEWPTTLVEIDLQENVEIERITTHANSPRHCDVTNAKRRNTNCPFISINA